MIDYINCKCVNLYNDQHQDLFVNDLSNMEGVLADFEVKIKSRDLQYEQLSNSNVHWLFLVNELDRFVDAIAFFELDDAFSLVALIVYTRNAINSEQNEFIYSVGYCVPEKYRGKGIAGRLVVESMLKLRSFLDSVGPNLDIGPDNSFKYTLESVVAQKNEPSNRLAKKVLHSGGNVVVAKERRSQEMSNVYKISI